MEGNSEDVVRVTVESNKLKLTLNNFMVRKLHHEKELLCNSYTETLHRYIPNHVVPITASESLEQRLRSLCSSTESQYKKVKGRNKPGFLLRERNITIDVGASVAAQTIETSCAENFHASLEPLVVVLQRELNERTTQNDELKATVSELNSRIKSIETKNEELARENETLDLLTHSGNINKGKKVGEGSKKTDQRKLKAVADTVACSVEDLLCSFGLNVKELFVEDLKGLLHRICYSESGASLVQSHVKPSFQGKGVTSYSQLGESDKNIVSSVASILDAHACSDTFWQELLRSVQGLPSLKLINSFREMVDSRLDIRKTPGKYNGAQVSFLEEVKVAILEMAKEQNVTLRELSAQPLTIKFEGDGCRISKKVSWTTLSFVVIDPKKRLQSHKLHRLLALVAMQENYFSIRESFRDLVEEISIVTKEKAVVVDGVNFAVKICLGSDLKFLLIVLGLQSASSKFPCPFCYADPGERCNVDMATRHFNTPPLARTLENLKLHCDALAYGVQYPAIFSVEPALVIPDTLHMCMRIVDRLLDNLIIEMGDFDRESQIRNDRRKNEHIDKFVDIVNSCGVNFAVWQDDKKGRTFTSLSGGDCQKLLQNLPGKLKGQLHPDTEPSVLFLRETLRNVLRHFESDVSGRSVEEKTRAFFAAFVDLGKTKRIGYGKARVTPYIHIFVHHASAKHTEFRCLGWYLSQGLEKKNDVLKTLHHGRSNKWNPAVDAIKLAKRLEVISNGARARPYVKSDLDFWNHGGIEESRKKRERSAADSFRSPRELDLESMSVGEIRTELRSLGVHTSTKCPTKLRDMLSKALQSAENENERLC